jgi:hypothetical protein
MADELATPAEWADEARVGNMPTQAEALADPPMPTVACESHCKCVTCRTADFEVYTYCVANAETLSNWIKLTTEQLDKTRDILLNNGTILEDVQDKYFGESFENRELFIHGVIEGVLRSEPQQPDAKEPGECMP